MNHKAQGVPQSSDGGEPAVPGRAPPPPADSGSDPNENLERWERELRQGEHGLGQEGEAAPTDPTGRPNR